MEYTVKPCLSRNKDQMYGVCVLSEGGSGGWWRRWLVTESCATYVYLSVKLLTFVYLYKVQLIGIDTIIVQNIRNSFKKQR